MRGKWGLWGAALVAVVLLIVAVSARAGEQPAFPHERHARLFPLCTGCHQGVPDGDTAAFYPPATLCARCHDGVHRDSVNWSPPVVRPTVPLKFAHPTHMGALSAAGDTALECSTCHVPEGAGRMAVAPEPVLTACFSCHGHPAAQHFVDAECRTCHVESVEHPDVGEWLATLPYPADHVTSEFLRGEHGRLAQARPERCATCHTQERCTSCHVNAESVPAIAAMPATPPSVKLPRYAAHYFIPPSHSATDFLDTHGGIASVEACSTCHTQNDCVACHAAQPPAEVAAMPRAEDVRAPGVLLQPQPPSSHRVASFTTKHGALAAADPSSCSSCHTRTMCSDCHEAAAVKVVLPQDLAGPRFHPDNFMAQHSAMAYGRELECASCHNVAAFCRDCHEQAGLGTSGRLDASFHDAEPNWLLRHGQPARQGLESCAACHEQSDCLQCHSETGSFSVSPHGRDFDPKRAKAKNPAICLACHVKEPVG